jgi:hypothetical protein
MSRRLHAALPYMELLQFIIGLPNTSQSHVDMYASSLGIHIEQAITLKQGTMTPGFHLQKTFTIYIFYSAAIFALLNWTEK